MRNTCIILLLLTICSALRADILHVGSGQAYATLTAAAQDVTPGDTIRIHEGVYAGGIYIENLQGTENNWILVESAVGAEVIFEGGNNAWQLTDAAYLHIRGFIFQHQNGNGFNNDDGGSYETPSHHVRIENCIFRDINASGNNDLLKLSGLDHFEIMNCVFINGAAGGSGIDMVGCHDGIITKCHFENLGSNSIQAKGGTSQIRIVSNYFKNGGQRSLNLGGSTGLEFFRPIDAPYEAAELYVYANVFIGSVAPIAFVGSIHCEVINNTIYFPEKWVLRILQETVDPDRFPPCGENIFRNNILYLDENVTVECNIGPNTDPESFTFSNNLWFHEDNNNWSGPNLPVLDTDNLINLDPLFADASNEDFSIPEQSPAVGSGYDVVEPTLDYADHLFSLPRSIGAFEGAISTAVFQLAPENQFSMTLSPNPASTTVYVSTSNSLTEPLEIVVFSPLGKEEMHRTVSYLQSHEAYELHLQELQPGLHFVLVKCSDGKTGMGKFIRVRD